MGATIVGGDIRTRLYEALGNMSEAWQLAADDLLSASQLLRLQAPASDPRTIVIGQDSVQPDVLAPELLLRGLALEVYFKAIWTKRGNSLVKGLEFKRIPNAGEHDLVQLAGELRLPITVPQRQLLARLSRYVQYAGRYPIPKKAEHLHLGSTALANDGRAEWKCLQDDVTFDEIMVIVQTELG